MSVKLLHHHHCLIFSSPSNLWPSPNLDKNHCLCSRVVDLNHLLHNGGNTNKIFLVKHTLRQNNNQISTCWLVERRKLRSTLHKPRKVGQFSVLASGEDGVTINGSSLLKADSDDKNMSVKLNKSLQGEDKSDGLFQSLHHASRVYELAIKGHSSLTKVSWLSTAWLGVDKAAWVKELSYQASVYSLLQAAKEISSRGDARDRDMNIIVQRSLLRQSTPLESIIRDKLSARLPEAYDWFWSEQVPLMVTTFVNYFEGDPRFTAATAVTREPMGARNASDISLLMLGLTCLAAITKLGPAKVSCPQFFSLITDITGRLMDALVGLVPIPQAYHSLKDVGLRREFLLHFGPRAAGCRFQNDGGIHEVVFWVDIVQNQLQRAVNRERIWSRLTTCESIEVLEKDLAILGFFIALGRNTQTFLYENGFDAVEEPLEGFIRYLIMGSVLYYPQLSSISSYQLYVEVVCEELDWFPFYPGNKGASKQSHGHNTKRESPPNAEAIPQVIAVCSYWMQSFIDHSGWLEDGSNVKAAKFLSRGHKMLSECMEDLGITKADLLDCEIKVSVENTQSQSPSSTKSEIDSFDKALESVEEALIRLEDLLQELHVSSSSSGKEHLKAACSDLEKIRKLKKEAEFFEASFRAKEASLQQGDNESGSRSSIPKKPQYIKRKDNTSSKSVDRRDRAVNNSSELWSFFQPRAIRKLDPVSLSFDDGSWEKSTPDAGIASSESNKIVRFELLRNELLELEKRVQSTDQTDTKEDTRIAKYSFRSKNKAQSTQLVQIEKKEHFIGKAIDKLKSATTDVLQGTQLLAIDVGAAMGFLRRSLIGDELTEKEKKTLKRTLTDVASVVPIGFLMLLPVTAVGHAAMLAAIQRYAPAMIPSTYGTDRLDLLRQLEKMKEMEASEAKPHKNSDN